MKPHQWIIAASNEFRKGNEIEQDGELIGEPVPISGRLLFDEGELEGSAKLGEIGLALYNPTTEQIAARDFDGMYYLLMADDQRRLDS